MSSVEFALLLIGLGVVATLYSSVGHGGASGYLAVMSLTSYGMMDVGWLKAHAWFLNILVAGIAFWHYRKEGFHELKLTLPFIIASVPLAFLGGYLLIDGILYDFLLSLTLVWAAWRLYNTVSLDALSKQINPTFTQALPWGAGIGFVSGVIGVGGGIFLSPVLMLKKWASAKRVAATSAMFIWVNSMAGLLGASFSRQVSLDVDVLLAFAVVVTLGGYVGSSYGAKVASQNSVKKLLIVVLLIAAAKRTVGIIGFL